MEKKGSMSGEEMRRIRHDLNLTQLELARRLGYTSKLANHSVHHWEIGTRPIPGAVVILMRGMVP